MPKTYPFEGQQRTLAEVMEMVACLGRTSVEERLKRGVTTRAGMLAEPSRGSSKRGGWRANGCKMHYGRRLAD